MIQTRGINRGILLLPTRSEKLVCSRKVGFLAVDIFKSSSSGYLDS